MYKQAMGIESDKVKAILEEIIVALNQLIATGQSTTIFTNKMSLTQDERQFLRDYLGEGSVSIKMSNTDELAEWLESGTSGIWYGVFYNPKRDPILETIEIAFFPEVASAYNEDIENASCGLRQKLNQFSV